jgi:hypothetical protein
MIHQNHEVENIQSPHILRIHFSESNEAAQANQQTRFMSAWNIGNMKVPNIGKIGADHVFKVASHDPKMIEST